MALNVPDSLNNMRYKLLPLIIPGLLCACSGGQKAPDAGAAELLARSKTELESGNPELALQLIDSLYHAYPSENELLKEGLVVRPQAMIVLSEQGIVKCDSAIAAAKAEIELVRSRMRWVKEKGMVEGYWIDRNSYNAGFFNTTGIQARVSDIGQFYIVSSVNPGSGHTSVTVKGPDGSASTPAVAYDGESNYRIGGGEVITFSPEQSDTIGKYVAGHAGKAMSLSFNGKGRKSISLSSAQTEGIANAYRLAAAMASGRDNDVERQRLERQRQLALVQIQRLDSAATASSSK